MNKPEFPKPRIIHEGFLPEPMTEYQPTPQTLEQKFEEIPELLDQLDALMEFYPLPTAVWRDIRKLMILSYDKGYSRGGYDTHMKYAGTD